DGIRRGRARLSALREELDLLIDDDNDLWYAFGFDKPSDPETPEVPENVVVTGGAAGMVFVDWDDARRASSYRVTISTTANPPSQLQSEIVEESEHTFGGLPAGTAIRVTVQARNHSGGESGPSAPGNGTVP
ncbi:MAG: fibronectin type III domain-containing protein, partial [Verrucomicrobiota bacterium]|nr:fibronectin type III domain-containing protein [Verrucomicrobiota bacterium]